MLDTRPSKMKANDPFFTEYSNYELSKNSWCESEMPSVIRIGKFPFNFRNSQDLPNYLITAVRQGHGLIPNTWQTLGLTVVGQHTLCFRLT